ncbi:unnamed protein product [Pieris macdunnoughi]|uniref:Ig-like domain-containing protein n=1 Tax=Pieris macdunnoughi TaxID=345717 RepID=A0A821X9F3_9NEOP|nr:unnamed protein product [Pieris macdunnoughi]
MPSIMSNLPDVKSSMITEVPVGSTAVLNCNSNDYEHNFMFWLFDKSTVIGPGNNHDEKKFKYEVLSGRLHIDKVSPAESGYYKCVSKTLDGSGISVGEVEMIVKGSTFSSMDAVKLVAIIISILVIIACAIIYYRLKKQWKKYDGRKVVPVDDDEDEDGDEIYNRTTTTMPEPVAGPSSNPSSEQLLYGIDNQGLDTDFNSVFENIQIKSPQASLI